jgi:TPR repeat protein
MSFNSFGDQLDKEKHEAIYILNEWGNGDITEKHFLEKLEVCSNKGNTFCLDGLCLYYYHLKNYKIAYSICSSYKTKTETGEIETLIGNMLFEGRGVLQNKNKALEHFLKSVSYGNAISAYNISRIYNEKMLRLKVSGNLDEEYRSNLIATYAWTKIAKALGIEKINNDNGEAIEISILIDIYRDWLIQLSLLQQGDELAAELCSHIKNCIQ